MGELKNVEENKVKVEKNKLSHLQSTKRNE